MIPSQIINNARLESGTTIDIVTANQARTLLNDIEKDFWRDISNESTGDKMNQFNINMVAGTNTYAIPQSVAASTLLTSSFGINQNVKIGIKLKATDSYYTPVTVKYVEWFLNLPDYYAAQTPTSSPTCYFIGSDSVVFFPTPTISMTAGIQIMWPKAVIPKSASTEDVEGMIIVPVDCHPVIVEGLKWKFYANMWVNFKDTALQQKQVYEAEKLRIINQLLNKNILSDEAFVPDLTYLG